MMNAASRADINGTLSTWEGTGWLCATVRLYFINKLRVAFNNFVMTAEFKANFQRFSSLFIDFFMTITVCTRKLMIYLYSGTLWRMLNCEVELSYSLFLEEPVQISGAQSAYFPKHQDCLTTKSSIQLQNNTLQNFIKELKDKGVQGEAQYACLVCG